MSYFHNHTHTHNKDHSRRNLLISIILNSAITLVQIIGGLISGSLALLSDALHNFSDVVSLVISYLASILANKKASITKTFGYKRAEIMAAFINSSTLIIVAVLLIFEAVERFNNPKPINSSLVIWLSLIAIAGNGFSVLLLQRSAKSNMNMQSAYLHMFTDMLASIAVLVGGLLIKYYQINWIDPFLTLVIALYLVIVGYKLLKNSFKVLMLFTPESLPVQKIVSEIQNLPNVKNLHHVHIWQLNEEETHLEAHIDFHNDINLTEFNIVLQSVENVLKQKYNINHVTLQPEYGKCEEKPIITQD
ncbi:MAG: cation transporter [Winogradskyella sp.]|nr:cation diffusion facilitator family transporter [Winogradskyella sp.]NNK39462.1 cation transporter [Winogradskyella sp.]